MVKWIAPTGRPIIPIIKEARASEFVWVRQILQLHVASRSIDTQCMGPIQDLTERKRIETNPPVTWASMHAWLETRNTTVTAIVRPCNWGTLQLKYTSWFSQIPYRCVFVTVICLQWNSLSDCIITKTQWLCNHHNFIWDKQFCGSKI